MLPPDPKFLPHKAAELKNGHSHDTAPFAPSGPSEALEQGAPPAALSSAPSLSTMVYAFRRAWKVAITVALLGAILVGGVAWYLIPAHYTGQVVFRISAVPALGAVEEEGHFANVQKAQMALVKSHDVLQEAIEKSKAEELYGVHFLPGKLPRRMIIHFNDGPEMMNVALTGENGEALEALLNALAEVYPKKINSDEESRVKTRIDRLRKRLQLNTTKDATQTLTLAEQLRDARVALHKAEKEAGLDDAKGIAGQYNHAQAMLQAVQQVARDKKFQRAGLESELIAKQARLKRPLDASVSESEIEESLSKDLEYQDLLKRMATTKGQISYIRRTYAASNLEKSLKKPTEELKQWEGEQEAIHAAARRRIANRKKALVQEQLERDVEEIKDKIEQANKQDAAMEADVKKWMIKVEEYRLGGPKASPEVEAQRDHVRQLETEYTQVGNKLAALEGALPLPPRVTVHNAAFVPMEKEYTRPLKYALAGGVLTFGLLVVGVCLLEARGRRVYASEDVMQGLGMRVVGTLPVLSVAARKKAALAQAMGGIDTRHGMNEAVDAIRTVLLHAPRIDGARVVMITSATSGEGKSTVASHLAASLARAWRKTLLIDGDLRNPAQHVQFDQPLEPGLCEALRGEVEYDDVVKPTMIGRLWMMPAGKVDGHALQALAQEGVSAVFERLKEQYDFIVLDTSPVLPVPDALLLGKQADAVLLSVMKDHTRMPAVYQAHQRLETLGIRVLGAVVIGEKGESYGHPLPRTGPKA